MENDLIILGKIIKLERRRHQLAQNVLAEKLAVNQSTISRMENGDVYITIENYQKALGFFNMTLDRDPICLKKHLIKIFEALDTGDNEMIQTLYKESDIGEISNYYNFYIRELIKASKLLHERKNKELKQLISELDEISDMFDERTKFIHLMLKGYGYHNNRLFNEANLVFIEALKLAETKGINDGKILYIIALNNIVLRKFRIAHLYLIKAVEYYKKVGNTFLVVASKRLLGVIYNFDSMYEETIEVINRCRKYPEVLVKAPVLRITFNSFQGVSYLSLGEYQAAIGFFEDNINHRLSDFLLEYYYIFLFYCLKKVGDEDKIQFYLNKLSSEPIYNEEKKRIFIDIFKVRERLFDIDQFHKHFALLSTHFFNFDDRYLYTKAIFNIVKQDLWKSRKYSVYKKMNDLILKYRLGGETIGL